MKKMQSSSSPKTPKFLVHPDTATQLKVQLRDASLTILDTYVSALTEYHNGKPVSRDAVVEGLIQSLAEDPFLKSYVASKDKPKAVVGASALKAREPQKEDYENEAEA